MPDLEKTIRGLECHVNEAPYDCPYGHNPDYPCSDPECEDQLMNDAISLLKEREEEQKNIIIWLGTFCTHIDFKDGFTLIDEERIHLFQKKMKEQFGWNVEVSLDG
ncbi:MAG: hypothetical protein IKH57_25720 [Clostridia bacterium]|nr:hypothetical protein [Clostridia bacterium]